MPKQVNIPNVGPVNFPDTMSQEDITAAARKLYDQHIPQEADAPTGVEMGSGERFLSNLRANHPLLQKLLPNWEQDRADLTAEEQRQGELAGTASTKSVIPGTEYLTGSSVPGAAALGTALQAFNPRNAHLAAGLAAGMERDIPESPALWATAAWNQLLGGVAAGAEYGAKVLPESLAKIAQPALMAGNAALSAGMVGNAVKGFYDTRNEHGLEAWLNRGSEATELGMGLLGGYQVGRAINGMRDVADFQRAERGQTPTEAPVSGVPTPQERVAAGTSEQKALPAPAGPKTSPEQLKTMLTEKANNIEEGFEPGEDEVEAHRQAMLRGMPDIFKNESLPEQLERSRQDLKAQEGTMASMIRDVAATSPSTAADLLKTQNPRVAAWYKYFGGPSFVEEVKPEPEEAQKAVGEGVEQIGDRFKVVNNQDKDKDQGGEEPGENPALLSVEEQIRNASKRLGPIQEALKNPELSVGDIETAAGRPFRSLRNNNFNPREQERYAQLAGRATKGKSTPLSASEQSAVSALGSQVDQMAAVRQFIADNELNKDVDREVFRRFQASQPAGTKTLDKVALQQFNAQNRTSVMRDVAELNGFTAPSTAPTAEEGEQLVKEGTLSKTGAAEAGAGLSEAERAELANLQRMGLKREGARYYNAITKSFLPKWQQAYADGGESSLTPDELSKLPPGVQKAIQQAISARQTATTPTQERPRTVVPQSTEGTVPTETPAAESATGSKERLAVSPAVPDGLQGASQADIAKIWYANQEAAKNARDAREAQSQAQTPPANPPTTPPPAATEPSSPSPASMTLQDLTRELAKYPDEKLTLADKIGRTMRATKTTWRDYGDKMSQAYGAVKWAAANAWQSYRHPLAWTNFDDAVGRYVGSNQVLANNIRNFAKTIIPRTSPEIREAMANYLDLGGDDQRIRTALANADDKWRPGYQRALDLTPQQKEMLNHIIAFQKSEEHEAIKAGVLNTSLQDYIMHVWRKPNENTVRMLSNLNFGELQTNPGFNRERIIPTYSEGEQKGLQPANKDVGFLIAAHHNAFGRAVAARAFIRELSGGDATDGRPLVVTSGVGIPVQREDGDTAYLIKPNANPAIKAYAKTAEQQEALINSGKLILPKDDTGPVKIDVGDYRRLDFPALRGWKWVAPGADGPVILQGDLMVHPEVYGKLKNILSRSALQMNPVTKALLSGSTGAKHTLLTLSMFHQTQEAVHAFGHGVNPFAPMKLDLDNPTQRFLVDHGLMVADFGSQADFSEGVGSQGLLKYAPVVGPLMHQYQDYLFRDYIPRLKMDMAMQAYGRNMERYAGKMSKDQIAALTARQANAAFGGLNYKLMGRNPTLQDVLRLTLLAPDFMEARTRFAAQAFTPYGGEQFHALLKIAAVQYFGARILNYLLDKDPHWDPQDAFHIVHNGQQYQIRSVPGDMLNAIEDTRGFIQHRANPLVIRPMIEFYTGRDEFGRIRTPGQKAADYFRNMVPIPLQGPIKKGDQTFADSILTSVGIESSRYYTPGERKALMYIRAVPYGQDTGADLERSRAFNQLRDQLRQGKVSWDQINAAYDAKKITDSQYSQLSQTVNEPNITRWVRRITPEQGMDVYKHASPQERDEIRDVLINKIANVKDADRQVQLYDQFDKLPH